MKYFLLMIIALFFQNAAFAQDANKGTPWAAPFPGLNVPMTAEGEVDTRPTCFRVINQAPYTVLGSLYTNYYVNKDRQRARHTSNFRLEKDQKQNFCTYGPYYDGRRLDLVLRTVLPIFSCRTMVDGDIYIKGEIKKDGGSKTWAECRPQAALQPGKLR